MFWIEQLNQQKLAILDQATKGRMGVVKEFFIALVSWKHPLNIILLLQKYNLRSFIWTKSITKI